jgi:predicted GNAT family acetyltransferase
MDKELRNAIERATQRARELLEEDFAAQLEGDFDVHGEGTVAAKPGAHLTARQVFQRERIVAAIEHKRGAGMNATDAVADYLRDAAFTTLNRFVALKMMEARDLVQECITSGEQSFGYREFCGMAPGLPLLPDSAGYRLYIESLFDELSTELKVLFDRRDLSSVLWPKRATLEHLLRILNASELTTVWGEDETIGWVYQFFNGAEERRRMREESQAPRNSRELAVRNQFFTPRYVVQFLSDNTIGRIWYEMRDGQTRLKEVCQYMVRRPAETWEPRPKKDPRDIRILDPACGSGHFLLYCFDLVLVMYEEAWSDETSPASEVTGKTLREDYPDIADLNAALPGLILNHNLHGIDIDPRCAQIGQLALWMRAQRVYRDYGFVRAKRPIIKRANIVIAEPMPGEKDLLKEFLAELKEDKLAGLIRRALDIPADKMVRATKAMADSLAALVETVWEGMKLAGDMGTLLKIERDLARAIDIGRAEWDDMLPLFRAADYGLGGEANEKLVRALPDELYDFWTKAERLVFQVLADYGAAATSSGNARRRLFAEDAAQGFALADLVSKRFDVVLMNPPFGAGSTRAKKDLEKAYPRTKNDVYAAFVERGIELLSSRGRVGAITSRTGLFLSSFQTWREEILLKETPVICADIGLGVMDAAMVEAAAYCLEKKDQSGTSTLFIRILEEQYDKQSALVREVARLWHDNGICSFTVDPRSFSSVPGSPFAYWVSDSMRRMFREHPPLETDGTSVCSGPDTGQDFRCIRTWWECPAQGTYTTGRWRPHAKGGVFSPFYLDVGLRLLWGDDGRELSAIPSANIRNAEKYFRPALTWSLRTKSDLSLRPMPAQCIFGHKGPAILVEGDDIDRLLSLLALANSKCFRALVEFQLAAADARRGGAARSYEVGVLQRTPVPRLTAEARQTLALLSRRAAALKRDLDSTREVSHVFVLPASLREKGVDTRLVERELRSILQEINEAAYQLYVVNAEDRATIEASSRRDTASDRDLEDSGDDEDTDANENEYSVDAAADTLVSWLVGVVFGRFDPRLATGERGAPLETGPFDPLPTRSPGMYPEGEDPADRPDILVDDEGHSVDLVARTQAVAERVSCEVPPDLRLWIAREFFPLHIKMYSRSRRKAPIYWQIATPSASYSVWLYIHAFTKDTLFRIQNDYVAPKLAHEERRLEAMTHEIRERATAAQRKVVAAQEAFVEELRALFDEVKRIAPLWNPNLDDGVTINFAPLWRLVPHYKPWQKELRAIWNVLCEGKCDWAHLAMHLWPERVVPKCSEDRSLAIAHDLEDVFWYRDEDEKWKPRDKPAKPIDVLVKERTSAAVKAALKSLIEAGAGTGNGGHVRGGRRRFGVRGKGDA